MKRSYLLVAGVAVAGLVAACGDSGTPSQSKPSATAASSAPAQAASAAAPKAVTVDREMLAAFAPLPKEAPNAKNPSTPEKVELGRQLYFDARLSKNHDVSCNTCHDLTKFGVDNKPTSPGHKGQLGTRNSPTVYGAALHFRQFWDGRAEDVEEQATMPITNPVEMAMPDEKRVVETLTSIPQYVEAFKKAFPEDKEPVSLANVGKAIGAFERTLLVRGKWDKYLEGDESALSESEKAGLVAFMEAGCQTCHAGPMLGGQNYQKLGSVRPWGESKDQGRYDHTKVDTDKMLFKTPTLRNIAKTGPYYHDGSIKDLSEATTKMAIHQLGKNLSEQQTRAIVRFLEALTMDAPPAELIKAPEAFPSTDKTPKADPS